MGWFFNVVLKYSGEGQLGSRGGSGIGFFRIEIPELWYFIPIKISYRKSQGASLDWDRFFEIYQDFCNLKFWRVLRYLDIREIGYLIDLPRLVGSNNLRHLKLFARYFLGWAIQCKLCQSLCVAVLYLEFHPELCATGWHTFSEVRVRNFSRSELIDLVW